MAQGGYLDSGGGSSNAFVAAAVVRNAAGAELRQKKLELRDVMRSFLCTCLW